MVPGRLQDLSKGQVSSDDIKYFISIKAKYIVDDRTNRRMNKRTDRQNKDHLYVWY